MLKKAKIEQLSKINLRYRILQMEWLSFHLVQYLVILPQTLSFI